jgi:hypothetical protein
MVGDLYGQDGCVPLTTVQSISASDNDIPEETSSINNPQCLQHENFDQYFIVPTEVCTQLKVNYSLAITST